MERNSFLAWVRRAAAAGRLTDPGTETPTEPPADTADLVARFRVGLEALGGEVHEPEAASVAEVVAGLLRDADADSFLSWDAEHLPVPGILDALAAHGYRRRDDVVPDTPEGRREHQLEYIDCAVGLTGAEAGLAESGSIVVSSGPGRPRMASLIPETHIALLRRDDLWPSLAHWIAANPDAPAAPANWTIITGPSRTADIEQVLTRGVHGPRDVHVVLI